jgi:glycosyltransferase involved in cell wall biosynthesis
MSGKSILLCSINAIDECGGGGIYLRTLFHELAAQASRLDVVCKKEKNTYNNPLGCFFYFKKTWLSDLVSRVLLAPCFLMFYVVSVLRQAKSGRYDVIVVHNSRAGMLVLCLSRVVKANIMVCFDNVEQALARDDNVSTGLRWLVQRVDKSLCRLSEYLCLRFAHKVSFITPTDAEYFLCAYPQLLKDYAVIPVKLPFTSVPARAKALWPRRPTLLFTASFAFYPNRLAAKAFYWLAKAHPDFDFVLAGSFLQALRLPKLSNLSLIESPSRSEMRDVFLRADVYLAPVDVGSGMKTKLAEAMSYGLCAIVTQHAAVGYEKALQDDFIQVVDDSTAMADSLVAKVKWLLKQDCRALSLQSHHRFVQNYSYHNILFKH